MSATRSLYRPGTHSPGRRMRGVSLLEMLLVVGLIAAASLLAAAAFTGGFAGAQLRSSAKEIAAQLRYTRTRAIATGQPQRFVIAPGRHPTVARAGSPMRWRCASPVPARCSRPAARGR